MFLSPLPSSYKEFERWYHQAAVDRLPLYRRISPAIVTVINETERKAIPPLSQRFKETEGLLYFESDIRELHRWIKQTEEVSLWANVNIGRIVCHEYNFFFFFYFDLKWKGAADVRSTIRIVESQKEKCDELRQQFHVLQERVQYLAQLKETLLVRLNQLLEAHCLSSSNSTRPTPRFLDELFADDGSLATPRYKTASINGEYQIAQEDEEQIDYNEALRSVASAIIKICSQVNMNHFFPSVLPLRVCHFFVWKKRTVKIWEPAWMKSLELSNDWWLFGFPPFFSFLFLFLFLLLSFWRRPVIIRYGSRDNGWAKGAKFI